VLQPDFAPRALSDLRSLRRYSVDNWGLERAEKYLAAINKTIQRLCERRIMGRPVVGRRYRYYRSESHYLFFRVVGSRLVVLRVLHTSMDFQRHLP
jgi:toxin ParE1/3/4